MTGRYFVRTSLRATVVVVLSLLASIVFAGEHAAPSLVAPDWTRVDGVATPPVIGARAAILVDAASDTILSAKNPDLVIPPASLTKLVTMHVALEAIENGELSLDQVIVPYQQAWAESLPPGSSLMFLGPDQKLTVRELLTGLVVASGNDAAIEVALLVSGSVPAFADRMNAVVRSMGLVDLFFVEPSGLSAENTITARSFARFVLAHIERFPFVLDDFYSVPSITYPSESNRTGPGAREPITQRNRNTLLARDPSVDGLKTGYIDESGYHLAVTADRDGRRLVAVVLGVDAPNSVAGSEERAREGAALLDYGFTAFRGLVVGAPEIPSVRVYKGTARDARTEAPQRFVISVPAERAADIAGTLDLTRAVIAPVPRSVVGQVGITLDGQSLAEEPVVLPAQERGSVVRRAWDSIVLGLRRVFHRGAGDAPVTADELAPAGL